MIDQETVAELEHIVGKPNISIAESDRITHSYDATKEQFLPDVVVYAESTEQVKRVVTLAAGKKIPILPRGAGSGFTGGTLPVRGGIVLVLTRMNSIVQIDSDNLIAVVQPGVVTADLQRAVEKKGLLYPPDPASKEFCTLGGNIGECAGGPRCLKYGVTKDFVMGLEVVTASGDVIRTGGQTLKNVVGYDLTKLFVGSEGTLGIVTEITLKLVPKPESKKTMLIQFDSIEGAAQAVSAIIRAKVVPATLEFLDAATIDCIRDISPIPLPSACRALLIIEVDGDLQLIEKQEQKILEVAQPLGVVDVRVAANDEESEQIWEVRRNVSPMLRKMKPDKINEDIVVPRSKVPDMIRALENIAREYNVDIVNFGHAGDGNIHVNVMVDLRDEGMEQKVHEVMERIFAVALELKGSLSGEHGIGTSKARYLSMELDPATITYMRAVKEAFDPDNILNPGKIFTDPR